MRQKLTGIFVGALGTAIVPGSVQAADRNAIQAATDAFGVSVGIEKIGLYTSDQVRGFSPTAAGNLRIDGLISTRLANSTSA